MLHGRETSPVSRAPPHPSRTRQGGRGHQTNDAPHPPLARESGPRAAPHGDAEFT